MGFFDNFKIKLLVKKINVNSNKRDIKVLPVEKYHSILILFDQEELLIKEQLESIFESSKISMLYRRTESDLPVEEKKYIYSYNKSDLGFGKIKRERLLGLLYTNFDLVIDFSTDITEFNYFVKKSKSTLKIGDLHSTKNYLYDLLVDRGNSDSDYIDNIKLQINILSQ